VVKAVATSAAHKRADKAMKQIVGGMMEVSATKYYSNITVGVLTTTTWLDW
jgi:hypothetical protein